MPINLENYIMVNERILKFYERYPNGRISTELVQWENGIVIMKANAYRHIEDEVPYATGFAYEKEDSSFITKTSVLEVCETSAVGRCLGIGGFEIQKSIASQEEMKQATELQIFDEIKNLYEEIKGNTDEFEKWFEDTRKNFNIHQIKEKLLRKKMKKNETV